MKLSIFFMTLACFLSSCSHVGNTSNKNGPLTYDARLTSFKYPYPVKNFNLNSQKTDMQMSYMDIGSTSAKVAVLLHGKNFSGFYWKRIAKDLTNKGYRVIVPDQIGFGKSTKPKNYQYSFSQLAINTEALLKSLDIKKVTLVGHSMGGMLATTMAYMFPELTSQLILINPIGLETYLDYVEFKDIDFFYKIELNKTPKGAIAYQKKNYYDGKWSPEYEKLLEPTFGQILGKDWPLVAWNNALTYGPIFSEDLLPRIKSLKVPTTLIIGTRDQTGPGRGWKRPGVNHKLGQYKKFGKSFKRLQPKAKVIELNGLGHMPQFEDYDRFSKSFYLLFK